MLLEMEPVPDPKVQVKEPNAFKAIRNGFAAFGRALLTILRLIADLIMNTSVGIGAEAKVTPLPVPIAGIGPSFLLCWDATPTFKRMLENMHRQVMAETCGTLFERGV